MHHPAPDSPAKHLSSGTFAAFHRAMLVFRQLLMKRMNEHGLHPGQAFCVAEISHNEGITQSELAESLGVSRPTVTIMLQKLEKAGTIERRSDEDDQRFTRLYLTQAGRAQYKTMHTIIGELTASTIEPMAEADQAELTRLLGMLSENIQRVLDATAEPAGPGSPERVR